MIQFRQKTYSSRIKLFSIEDGGYQGGKRSTSKGGYGKAAVIGSVLGGIAGAFTGNDSGVPVGAAFGAGLGAFFRWMTNIADESEFNTSRSNNCNSYILIQSIEDYYAPEQADEDEETVSTTETDSTGRTITRTRRVQTNKKEVTSPKGVVYDVDADPKKYTLSLLYQGNVLVMYLNNVNNREIKTLDNILDNYCYKYRNADYCAEKVEKAKDSYVVEMAMISGTELGVVMSLINSGFKLNIITGSKFGINKR